MVCVASVFSCLLSEWRVLASGHRAGVTLRLLQFTFSRLPQVTNLSTNPRESMNSWVGRGWTAQAGTILNS